MRALLRPELSLLAAGLGLLTAPAASAQTSFGVRAGLNVANASFNEDETPVFGGTELEKQSRLGLVAGVFADIALTPSLSFHPEVLYAQKGFRVVTVDDADVDGSITQQLDYVEVPLLLSYRIPAGPNGLVFGIEGGPAVAFKVNTGYSCSGDLEPFCELFESDGGIDDDGVRDLDVGAALGLTVGAGPFGVGARYTQGLTTIGDAEDEADAVDARNQAFSVTAHYTF